MKTAGKLLTDSKRGKQGRQLSWCHSGLVVVLNIFSQSQNLNIPKAWITAVFYYVTMSYIFSCWVKSAQLGSGLFAVALVYLRQTWRSKARWQLSLTVNPHPHPLMLPRMTSGSSFWRGGFRSSNTTVMTRWVITRRPRDGALTSKVGRKYCLISTSYQQTGYLTFSYYFIFDRIVFWWLFTNEDTSWCLSWGIWISLAFNPGHILIKGFYSNFPTTFPDLLIWEFPQDVLMSEDFRY